MALKQIFDRPAEQKEDVEQYLLHGVKVNVAPSEKKFAEDLFDSLASIPSGRNAIADMKKYKVDFFLETALGTAGGYFDPENNRIVMAKSLGMDFMEFALVHEARHLWQNNQGRNEAEEQNLDYATRLMINRATEADAQAQAIQACKEWQAQGHDAPMKRFEKHYQPITDRFAKNQTYSEAFKGWFDDERIPASYEQGYDVEPCLDNLTEEPDTRPYVSMTPEQVSKFCGGDRVEDFAGFMKSEQARKVHLLTKTAVELFDASMAAQGAPHDPSLKTVPVRDLRGNAGAQMYAAKYIKETRENYAPAGAKDENRKTALQIVMNAVDAVEKVNAAAVKGEKSAEAEKALKIEKSKMRTAVKPAPARSDGGISLIYRGTER